MSKDRTRFINDESQVPAGWIPLADLAAGDKTTKRALTEAHMEGRIEAVKLVRHRGDLKTGRVWMKPEDVDAFFASYRTVRRAASTAVAEAPKQQGEELVAALSRDIQALRDSIAGLHPAVQNLQAAFELFVGSK